MCLFCHQSMPDETVKKQLLQSVENPQFELWNATSLNHLIISVVGFNGYEVSDLAYKLVKDYIAWKNDDSLKDFEEKIEKLHSYVISGKEKGITDEELKEASKNIMENV